MKSKVLFVLGILLLLVIAGVSYQYATGAIDSMYSFRSPIKDNPPQAGQSSNPAATRRVVFVLIDALRYDTSQQADVMPVLNQLRQVGADAVMHSQPPSFSEPGYSTLLTGGWPYLNDGPAFNLPYEEIRTFTQDNIFSAASRSGLKTAVSGYYWFEKLIPQSDVSASFYTPGEDQKADEDVMKAALPWLASDQFRLILIHLDQVDYAGHHQGGPKSENWKVAAQRTDAMLAQIVKELDLSQDTLLVCSDHGQIDAGGHGGNDPVTLVEPFILAGAGVKSGHYDDISMVDVAPTLAVLLGTNLPASGQGTPRFEMLSLSPEALENYRQQLSGQQAALASRYTRAIGQPSSENKAPDSVAAAQKVIENARSNRLAADRTSRIPFAFLAFALLVSAWTIARFPGNLWPWLGGMVYLVLFNLRYALLDQKAYSLSVITSQSDLIIYCGVTCFIALLIAWIIAGLGWKMFTARPFIAAGRSLILSFSVISLLLLPVIWSYEWNGLFASWTIPELSSMFIAFLSAIQILLSSILAILFAGAAALIAKINSKKVLGD